MEFLNCHSGPTEYSFLEPVSKLIPENKKFSNSEMPEYKAGFQCCCFINSVCSQLYTYEDNKTAAGSPGTFTPCVVRSVYVVAQVGHVWYHRVFIFQTKSDGLTILCTVKQKGKSFKYQNTETKIK